MKPDKSLAPHVANYFQAFGYDKSDTILCEVCSAVSHDLHHVEPRSKFGSTQKHLQDDPSNIVALCRSCHDDAHGPKSREVKEALKELIKRRYAKLLTASADWPLTQNMDKKKLKEIDNKIAKLFESLESEINKRSEFTPEQHMNYLASMTEHVIQAISQFSRIKS